MKKVLLFVALAALAATPGVAQAQPMAMSAATLGVGAHGWDSLIGTWTCTNTTPSAIGGPSTTTIKVSRSTAGPQLFIRISGTNFDATSYQVYSAKTKTWWNPSAYADGSYSSESTTQTGKKTVWSGPYVNAASGKTMQIRDTYAFVSSNKFTDLGEYQAGGAWKTQYTNTCTRG